MNKHIKGVLTAIVTPFDADGAVNPNALETTN